MSSADYKKMKKANYNSSTMLTAITRLIILGANYPPAHHVV